MADQPLSKLVDELIAKMRGPLGLDRWQIKVLFGPGDDTAACSAMPEYRMATIAVDPDKLDTGDELDEIIAHELCHALTWPIGSAADDLAIAVAEMLPESCILPMGKLLKETVRKAEEESATAVGRALVTLFRSLWAAETELATAKAEMRILRKAVRDGGAT